MATPRLYPPDSPVLHPDTQLDITYSSDAWWGEFHISDSLADEKRLHPSPPTTSPAQQYIGAESGLPINITWINQGEAGRLPKASIENRTEGVHSRGYLSTEGISLVMEATRGQSRRGLHSELVKGTQAIAAQTLYERLRAPERLRSGDHRTYAGLAGMIGSMGMLAIDNLDGRVDSPYSTASALAIAAIAGGVILRKHRALENSSNEAKARDESKQAAKLIGLHLQHKTFDDDVVWMDNWLKSPRFLGLPYSPHHLN